MTAHHLIDLDGTCIRQLDETGQLLRVRSEVDLVHELAGIAPTSASRAARPSSSSA